jgi:hypothetical protein
MVAIPAADPRQFHDAMKACTAALRRMADYQLDPALDRRMLELGENKEFIDEKAHEELLALAALASQRSLEKLEAEAALQRLRQVCPDMEEAA